MKGGKKEEEEGERRGKGYVVEIDFYKRGIEDKIHIYRIKYIIYI